MTDEKEVPKVAQSCGNNGKRCSCFDDECVEVKDPLRCFMGTMGIGVGLHVEIGVADGYCPLIHDSN